MGAAVLLLVREKTSRFATVRVRAVTFVFVDDVEDVEDVEDRVVEDHDEEGLDGWCHDGLVLLVREKTFRFATIRASMSFYIEDEDDEIIVINNSIDRAVRETMLMKRGRPEASQCCCQVDAAERPQDSQKMTVKLQIAKSS